MNKDTQSAQLNSESPTDWRTTHLRLEKVRETLGRGFVLTPEEKKQILRARAKILARDSAEPETVDESIEIVEFLLANEKYGIESSYVREVYPVKELTPLPCTPSFVYGIMNVRGQIVSVIDIKKFFDLPEKGLTDLNKVIVVQNETMELGILADALLGVRSVPFREIQPPLPTLTGIRAEYLRGVTKESLIIFDIETFLTDKKIIVHEEIGS